MREIGNEMNCLMNSIIKRLQSVYAFQFTLNITFTFICKSLHFHGNLQSSNLSQSAGMISRMLEVVARLPALHQVVPYLLHRLDHINIEVNKLSINITSFFYHWIVLVFVIIIILLIKVVVLLNCLLLIGVVLFWFVFIDLVLSICGLFMLFSAAN